MAGARPAAAASPSSPAWLCSQAGILRAEDAPPAARGDAPFTAGPSVPSLAGSGCGRPRSSPSNLPPPRGIARGWRRAAGGAAGVCCGAPAPGAAGAGTPGAGGADGAGAGLSSWPHAVSASAAPRARPPRSAAPILAPSPISRRGARPRTAAQYTVARRAARCRPPRRPVQFPSQEDGPNVSVPDWLRIHGARQNNLKNVCVSLPHDRVTVITGVSGSGKSSLAFDTLFAEGQWRYIESLSSYARMFLERIDRPDVDHIEHIRPAIALEQKNPVRTARSTVEHRHRAGRLPAPPLRQGRPRPLPAVRTRRARPRRSGSPRGWCAGTPGARALVCFPVAVRAGAGRRAAGRLVARGLRAGKVGGDVLPLTPLPEIDLARPHGARSCSIASCSTPMARPAWPAPSSRPSPRAAGAAVVELPPATARGTAVRYGERFGCHACDTTLERPQPLLFSFNHPLGACPECRGFGNLLRYDESRVVPGPEPARSPTARSSRGGIPRGSGTRRADAGRPAPQGGRPHPYRELPEAIGGGSSRATTTSAGSAASSRRWRGTATSSTCGSSSPVTGARPRARAAAAPGSSRRRSR